MADRFPLRPGRLLTVTLAALVAGCTSAPTPRAGQPSPELWSDLDDDQVAVAWIFRAEDCLSCNTPVRPFRQLQARYADRVRFQALAVSDAPDDRALVASFLKRERLLSFETRLLNLGQYRGSFGQQTLPAVVVLAGGRLLGVWDDRATRVAEGFGDARTTVDEVLQRVFARGVADRQATVRTDPSKTPHPSSHQPGG